LTPDDPDIAEEMATGKVHILRCRDNKGRLVGVWLLLTTVKSVKRSP
jgi:hypothetical protein